MLRNKNLMVTLEQIEHILKDSHVDFVSEIMLILEDIALKNGCIQSLERKKSGELTYEKNTQSEA